MRSHSPGLLDQASITPAYRNIHNCRHEFGLLAYQLGCEILLHEAKQQDFAARQAKNACSKGRAKLHIRRAQAKERRRWSYLRGIYGWPTT